VSQIFERPSHWSRLKLVFAGFDGPLLLALLILGAIGLVAMYSAGYDHGTRFVDHGRNMLLALAVVFVVAQVPPQKLQQLAVPLYVLGVALLVATAVFGITRKGATRWLALGPLVLQPSEILKIAMPIMLAWWFQKREGQLRVLDFAIAGLLLLVPVALVIKQPDLGTALLILAGGVYVIFFAGLSWKLVIPALVLGGLGIAGAGGVGRRHLRTWRQLATAARLPAAPRVHAAGPHQGPAGQGLSHHPGHDCHRLGRAGRQGLHAGHADAP
jgi:rod shape determining protein RodA